MCTGNLKGHSQLFGELIRENSNLIGYLTQTPKVQMLGLQPCLVIKTVGFRASF